MSEQDDLIGNLIAEVARSHGVAISRDDPIVAVVHVNQIVLRRYLEETVAPAADAIPDATNEAVRQIEQFAEAQATWLEQVSLRDRASFLAEQTALHDAWETEAELLIKGQNTALRQVVGRQRHCCGLKGPGRGLHDHGHRPTASGNGTSGVWAGHSLGLDLGGGADGNRGDRGLTLIAWLQLSAQSAKQRWRTGQHGS